MKSGLAELERWIVNVKDEVDAVYLLLYSHLCMEKPLISSLTDYSICETSVCRDFLARTQIHQTSRWFPGKRNH